MMVLRTVVCGGLLVGGLGLSITAAVIDPAATAGALLAVCWTVLAPAFGALLFLQILHAAKARWVLPARRCLENAWILWPVSLLMAIIVLAAAPWLYPWARDSAHVPPHLQEVVAHQASWYGWWWVGLRLVVTIGAPMVLAWTLWRWSLRRDHAGDPAAWEDRSRRWSAGALPVVVLLGSVAVIDQLLALHPHQHSTVLPLLILVAGTQAACAALVLASFVARRTTALRLQAGQWYGLGTLLFALSCVWAYAHLSQWLIIVMGDLPAKVPWIQARIDGNWQLVAGAVLAGRFVLPFLALAMRSMRHSPEAISGVALVILLSHLLEAAWWVLPGLELDAVVVLVAWAGALAVVLGLLLLLAAGAWRQGGWSVRHDRAWSRALAHHPGGDL